MQNFCIKNQSNIFFTYIGMSTGYYQKNKEKLQKEAYERYQNISKERKNKKQKEAREKYRNLSGE